MQLLKNLSCDVLNISYNDFIPKTSLRDLILSQRLNPKTLRRALLTAKLQFDISEAENSLTEQAYVSKGKQLQ